jgi:hypothetical protein
MLEYFLAVALHAWNGSKKKAEMESRHRQAEERRRESARKAWRAEAAAREKRQRDAEIREQRALLEHIEAKLRPQNELSGKESQKTLAGGSGKMDEREFRRRAEERRLRNLEAAKARMAEEDRKRHEREEIERLRKERNRLANENARLRWEARHRQEGGSGTPPPEKKPVPVQMPEIPDPEPRTSPERVGFRFTFRSRTERN